MAVFNPDQIAADGLIGPKSYEAAIGAAIDRATSWRSRIIPPVLLGLIMLFDSWDSSAIAYVLPVLASDWRLQPVIMGTIISAGFAGQFIGAVGMGPIAERHGRMPVIFTSVVVMALLGIACALAASYQTLIILRFIQGIFIGGALPVAITYINELAPSATRGRYFSIFQMITMSGYTCASLSSVYIVPNFGWHWMFALGATPLLVLPVAYVMLPESPRWLARKGDLGVINRALAKLGVAPIARSDAAAVQPIESAVAGRPGKMPISELFAAPYLQRTITMAMLWFTVSLVSFGFTSWLPSIYTKEFHVPLKSALFFSATSSIIYLFSMPVTGIIIDKIGRRPMTIAYSAISASALLVISSLTNPPVSLLVPLVITSHVAISSVLLILWPYSAETYPTKVRATALGLMSAFGRSASVVTPLAIGGILSATRSVHYVFVMFAVCAVITLVLWLTRTRETAGRSLDEVV